MESGSGALKGVMGFAVCLGDPRTGLNLMEGRHRTDGKWRDGSCYFCYCLKRTQYRSKRSQSKIWH